jgi:TatD DNase family protein
MTYGWGPQTVTYSSESEHDRDFPKYIEFLKNSSDEFVGIGEIGLDFHHAKTFKKRERQIEIFERIIRESKHLDKPYILHVRNAGPRDVDPDNPNDSYNESDIVNRIILEILEDEKIPPQNVMWHCFSGPSQYGPHLAEEGYYISIPSSAFGFNKWRRNSMGIPLNKILTETDAAWQHPYKIGAFNSPVNVKFAIAAIAYSNNLKQMEVAENVLKNAISLFRIDNQE